MDAQSDLSRHMVHRSKGRFSPGVAYCLAFWVKFLADNIEICFLFFPENRF